MPAELRQKSEIFDSSLSHALNTELSPQDLISTPNADTAAIRASTLFTKSEHRLTAKPGHERRVANSHYSRGIEHLKLRERADAKQ